MGSSRPRAVPWVRPRELSGRASRLPDQALRRPAAGPRTAGGRRRGPSAGAAGCAAHAVASVARRLAAAPATPRRRLARGVLRRPSAPLIVEQVSERNVAPVSFRGSELCARVSMPRIGPPRVSGGHLRRWPTGPSRGRGRSASGPHRVRLPRRSRSSHVGGARVTERACLRRSAHASDRPAEVRPKTRNCAGGGARTLTPLRAQRF